MAHVPHGTSSPPTTGAPTAQPSAPGPTAATRPDHSWPPTVPGRPHPSRTTWMSVPQTPQWLTSTSTSPGPGAGTGLDPTVISPLAPYTATGISDGGVTPEG